jgi:hypothetical protein
MISGSDANGSREGQASQAEAFFVRRNEGLVWVLIQKPIFSFFSFV